MRQMDVWLRWFASVSPANASWSEASATDGRERKFRGEQRKRVFSLDNYLSWMSYPIACVVIK